VFAEHAQAFDYRRGAWLVPSENGLGAYEVRLGPLEVCKCAGFGHRGGL
jgi:hypothetical protein